MSRTGAVVQKLGLLARGFTTSSYVASVPASVSKPSGGMFGFMGKKDAMPPMNVPLAGVDVLTPTAVPSSYPAVEASTLSNGIQVASHDLMSPMVSVAVLVESGSIYEARGTEGATQLIQHMAFKGTNKRTHFATTRQAENYGIHLSTNTNRESTIYWATAPRDAVAPAMELLLDSALNPHYQEHILNDVKAELSEHNSAALLDPMHMAMEGIVSAAYQGALARPCLWLGGPMSTEMLTEFHSHYYTPGNTHITAAGVPLATLKGLAEELAGTMPQRPTPPKMPSTYVGGSAAEHFTGSATSLIAFEGPGWVSLEESLTGTILGFALGGGQDFSSGGPGKGMHSRLYQNILAQRPWITSASFFNSTYENTGLMGIYATTPDATRGDELVSVVCTELENIANGISDVELQRAKNMCESSVYHALEMPQIAAEDIGRQLITYGRHVGVPEFVERLNEIDGPKVQAFARKLLSSKPSGVLIGDQATMPKWDTIARRFS